MESSKCRMCGLLHNGKYVVCSACISEYNLTSDQITEMGGLRVNDAETISDDINTDIPEEAATIPDGTRKTTTSDEQTDQEQDNEKGDMEETYAPESYTNVLYHIAHDLDIIKSIMVFYFVITVIGLVIYILTAMSSGN